jgi:hypothetical protein
MAQSLNLAIDDLESWRESDAFRWSQALCDYVCPRDYVRVIRLGGFGLDRLGRLICGGEITEETVNFLSICGAKICQN